MRFPNEQVLGELLPLNAAPITRRYPKSRIQQPRDGLHRIQLAIAVQWKTDHVTRVLLVPGNPRPGVHQSLTRLREDLIEQCTVTGQHDALAQIRTDMEGDAFVGVLGADGVAGAELRFAGIAANCGF